MVLGSYSNANKGVYTAAAKMIECNLCPTNISKAPGGPINGLRVRMHDKIARINNLIDKGVDPQNESLRDSFIDLLNYSAIAIMVLENKWPSE